MKTFFPVTKCLVLGGLALAAFQIAAAPMTYIGYDGNDQNANGIIPIGSAFSTTRALFESTLNTSGVRRETFGTNGVPAGVSLSVLGGTSTITQEPLLVEGPNGSVNLGLRGSVKNVPGGGRFNTTGFGSGNQSPAGAFWETDGVFSVNLGEKYQAFGFDVTDFGDFDAALTMTLFNGQQQGQVLTLIRPPTSLVLNASLLFYGFSSDIDFDRIRFSITQLIPRDSSSYDAAGFDQFTVGRLVPSGPPGTIPEPTSLALVGISLALLVFARRRQTKA